MTTVFFDIGISLDGFMAGPNRGPHNPLGDGGVSMHQWMFRTTFGRERLGIPGDGGETSADNELLRGVFERTGAYIMRRRMFEEGGPNWPENAPFRAPVFVLTHQPRDPWARKGARPATFDIEQSAISSSPHVAHVSYRVKRQ